MSGPSQRPPFISHNSSPLSPYPRDGTPVSFKTNVNRAKTKRWVDAKKYTYDGDDWGEDEYGEYEYDDEPAQSQAQRTGVNRSTPDISSTLSRDTAHPPLPSMDRSRSMERAQTMPSEGTAASGSPTTPIVRPADIYKRMREEQNTSQSSPPPKEDSTLATSATVTSPPVTAAGSFGNTTPLAEATHEPRVETDQAIAPLSTTDEAPTISLPVMKRMSAFGSNFFTEPESDTQRNHDPADQPHQLQHNPSLGFRSAVNQAFDVPETPSTTAESVARSNSDSTAGISPIIGRRDTTDDKTPTIPEEPNESADTPTEGNIIFKPGHRRDLSIPSPGNSPSRKPEIAGPDTSVSSGLAEITSGTPADSPLEHPPSQQPRSDLPAPLNVQTNMVHSPTTSTDNIPVIIPAMSTETSPADTENDRLRKEIIRSLSRENSPSEHQDNETPPQTSGHGQDSLFLREYEPLSSGLQQPGSIVPAQSQTSTIEQPTPIPPQSAQPKLKKRFSWEESSSDEEPTPVPQTLPTRPPPMPGQFPLSQDSVHPESLVPSISQPAEHMEHAGSADEPIPEKPRLTVVPPLSVDDTTSISSSNHVPEHLPSQTTETLARAEEGELFSPGQQQLGSPARMPSPPNEAGLLGFKDILGIQSSDGRVQAFDRTRDQFAGIDTGLNHWLQVMVYTHPEHADVIDRNSKPLSEEFRNSVPRTKFPKLASLGNLASSLQDGSHSTSGHIRRPSAPLGSIRQQSGKDFLHTAGVLGGQAGKAAKGFFSKGRSKLKGGGSEKGFQSMGGYHRPIRLSDLQLDAEHNLDLEDPLVLHIPPSRGDGNAAPTRGGEYFFVQPSTLTASGQFGGQSAGQQRRPGSSKCDPCPIERQEEPHQDGSRHSASKNGAAACDGVDHLGAKPRAGLRKPDFTEGEDQTTPASHEEETRQLLFPALHDTAAQSRDTFPPLHQLPSAPYLCEQETDLGPLRPLVQKLAQDNCSFQLSLPSYRRESQPRNLGGSPRRRGVQRDLDQGKSGFSESASAQGEVIQTSPVPECGCATSTPGLQSPFSPKHDWLRRPEQTSSSRDPAAHRSSFSPMEKLKNVGRFRRISLGPGQPDHKTEQPKKHSRLSGIFSRHQHRKSVPTGPTLELSSEGSTRHHLAPVSSRPEFGIAGSSVSLVDYHERPVSLPNSRNVYHGRHQPVGGYFAHETPESFSVGGPYPPDVCGAASTDRIRMSDPTPIDRRRLSPHSPPYLTSTSQWQPHASSTQLSSPLPSPIPRTPPSRGRSEERTYAQELHLRSRSPKAFAPRPEERNLPKHDPFDPAFNLGAFKSSNPRTSRIGDQELPWKITIPGDDSETTTHSTSASWRQETEEVLDVTRIRLPTYQEDEEEHGPPIHQPPIDAKESPPAPPPNHPATIEPTSHPNPNIVLPAHPHRSGARTINVVDNPVELPVRTDDNSSEEIMMSSTAYPGQEWRPLGYSEWEHQ